MESRPVLFWFRLDLRLRNNPGLVAAVSTKAPVIPVFVWAPEQEEPWPPGAASRWWLHQSLKSLQNDLAQIGSRLIIRRGGSQQIFDELVLETQARAVYWNRRFEPATRERDIGVQKHLEMQGIEVATANSALLFEPGTICNASGRAFQVFTAFWKTCLKQTGPAEALAAPKAWESPRQWPASLRLEDLELEPKIDWAAGMRAAWKPGEEGAQQELKRFLAGVEGYASDRNYPSKPGTSRLSPHLHFDEISPRELWHSILARRNRENAAAVDAYLREVGWREFAYYLLFHFPFTADECLRREFDRFPWSNNRDLLRRWQRGETGYPLVDAGMRELWSTGWMHNRVRLVAASFLTKHLRMRWQEGAYWFWDTLVDADLANNALGWQWTAGCGADAAPYFRICNPVLQSEKFDPEGDYIRCWAPELRGLPVPWIHKPWTAPELVLAEAVVQLGVNYPFPIVEHERARREALQAYERLRK